MRLLLRNLKIVLFLLCSTPAVVGQSIFEHADSLNSKRRTTNIVFQGVTTVSTLGALQFAWYQDYQSGGFRLFDDWKGWMQMDKIGHSATNYQIAADLYRINRWTGASKKSSIWWAAGMAFGYQLTVEVMDGFSEGWGFSMYDLGFNTIGAGTFLGQQILWDEQRFKLKYSFWPSGLDQMNDFGDNYLEVQRAQSLFGKGLHEQWLKDYNGQTYWLSANVWSMVGKPDRFPKWLNLSLGYSINGVLGAESNTWNIADGEGEMLYMSNITRERQLLISLDIDLDHVNLPPYLVWIRPVVSLIKFPFPALEWNTERGLIAHPVYF